MSRTRVRRARRTTFPTVLKSRRRTRLARERKISGQGERLECGKQIVREHVQSEPGGVRAELPTPEGRAVSSRISDPKARVVTSLGCPTSSISKGNGAGG